MYVENGSRKARKLLNLDWISPDLSTGIRGINDFPGFTDVYWTDASFDAATKEGRQEIANRLGIKLEDIVAFSAKMHTNEIVIVDSPEFIKAKEKLKIPNSDSESNEIDAGWSEPVTPDEFSEKEYISLGAQRGTYDGIILIGRKNFEGKYLLATGADCTPVGVRGMLKNGEEFIAIVHAGRKGTMGGIMENLARRLVFFGVDVNSLDIFVGPAAQAIEVPLETLEKKVIHNDVDVGDDRVEDGDDNSWRVSGIGDVYEKDGILKTKYNNQTDATRRFVENIGVIKEGQVHVIDIDTVSEEYKGKLHSYRRDKTAARNALILGFEKKDEDLPL